MTTKIDPVIEERALSLRESIPVLRKDIEGVARAHELIGWGRAVTYMAGHGIEMCVDSIVVARVSCPSCGKRSIISVRIDKEEVDDYKEASWNCDCGCYFSARNIRNRTNIHRSEFEDLKIKDFNSQMVLIGETDSWGAYRESLRFFSTPKYIDKEIWRNFDKFYRLEQDSLKTISEEELKSALSVSSL